MVGLENGLFDFVCVGVEKKTAAKKKKHFSIPDNMPRDYSAPEYKSIARRERIGLDIETIDPDLSRLGSGAHRKDGKIVGVAIAYAKNDANYYPIAHDVGENVADTNAFIHALRSEALEFRGEIVGANLQYDLDWLRARHGIIFPKARFCDVQIAEPLLDENRLTYRLDNLAKDYLGESKSYDELTELYGRGYIENMNRVHPAHAASYANADATLAWRIFDAQSEKLERENLTELFKVESALTPLLLDMRYHGVRVDLDKAKQSYDRLKAEQKEIEARIADIGKTYVDIWAADSIAAAFDNVGIEYKRTATGRPSFQKAWLAACPHELAKSIVKARENDKIAGTFIQSYILDAHIDGRIHCSFNQLKSDSSGTVSGRFSSSNPNLQNIPIRHETLGPLMRSMFIPEPDMQWGSLDWSQIEYRLLVHYASKTPGVYADDAVKAYKTDANCDFHTMASEITGVPRAQAKGINFGVVYGMGVASLARHLEVTTDEAKAVMRKFQESAPFMRGMLDLCAARASEKGEIRTILGRKRRFNMFEVRLRGKSEPQYVSENDLESFCVGKEIFGTPRRAFVHKALNALLQGSAADLMKKAMVQMWDDKIFDVLTPHLTVHDEFNASIPKTKEGMEAFAEMRNIMQTAVKLDIPILANGALGANWGEAK